MAKQVNYRDVLSMIIKIWIVCFGALTLQVEAGYFMSHVLLPYVGFLLIMLIVWRGNRNLQKYTINCSLLTHYTAYILAASGVVMLVANLMNTNFISNRYSEFANQNYPFHASFIVYPVAAVFYGIAMLRRGSAQYCLACRANAELSVEEALRRNVLHHEAKIQIRMAFAISLIMAVVTYAYYYLFYKSGVSYRKYSPDVFFMYILPAVAFVLSVIYVVSRYFTVEMEISLQIPHDEGSSASRIRFMVVWRDQLLLRDIVGDGVSCMWDTPASVSVPYAEQISDWEARKSFRRLYGSEDFEFRRLYFTSHDRKNCLHCAAFLDDEHDDVNAMGGQWFSLREVDMMLKSGFITRTFALELHRVFTITMAWKTYDRDGHRLYPIKNYRPTFRLRDFKTWTVDYEDLQWLSIAENNEDKPLYALRRLWRTYITGVDKRWGKSSS